MKHALSPRQVHLDFHTSPLMEGIGSQFSRENFQEALKLGHLTSITVFAKCHHGMCYYPTKIGTMHPHLDFDLLGEMLDAAHEIGVKAPIYITAGWSALDAEQHPEWRARRKDGSYSVVNIDPNAAPDDPRPECSWADLCLNDGSYAEHIYALTREICDRYAHIDGLFYDIVFNYHACWCDECRAGMRAMGLDPEKDEDARLYYVRKHQDFTRKCGEILHEKHPDASIYFNSGGADQYQPEFHGASTHFELEDLPTAWGGYNKMPPRARYFANTGKDYLGMTGKFHLDWGEIGGFKLPEALRYEAAAMMAYGARCSIGDHLHPNGRMELETYRNIGYAYEYAEQIEPYCFNGKPAARLGLYLSGDARSDDGATNMLLEAQRDFGIVYENNFEPFDTVIFPDCAVPDEEGVKALQAFLARGGRVLFTGRSLVKDGAFQIDAGLEYVGGPLHKRDFLRVNDELGENVVRAPMLCYFGAEQVRADGAQVLATALEPYFDRTYAHYNGHRNASYNPADSGRPAAAQYGNILYLAHPLCRMYRDFGAVYHKRVFLNALNRLDPHPVLETELPSAGRATVIRQPDQNRYCVHLLYGIPSRRGAAEVIEDLPALFDVPVTVRVPETIRSVRLEPEGTALPFICRDGAVSFRVPRLQCHTVAVLEE